MTRRLQVTPVSGKARTSRLAGLQARVLATNEKTFRELADGVAAWLPQDLTGARCVIAGLVSAKDQGVAARVADLTEQIAARGGETVGTVIQRRGVSRAKQPGGAKRMSAPLSAATFLGPGKVRELAALAAGAKAAAIVLLNPPRDAQRSRLETATRCMVFAPIRGGAEADAS